MTKFLKIIFTTLRKQKTQKKAKFFSVFLEILMNIFVFLCKKPIAQAMAI